MIQNESVVAVFGSGCFWCSQAVFDTVEGVTKTEVGYAAGMTKSPSYEQVCSGETGHAEVVRVEYDPTIVTFEKLLEVFFKTHDPTTLNRQGADVGSQYRSIILYTTPQQREEARAMIDQLNQGRDMSRVVTQLEPLETFYPAKEYHQHYFDKNPQAAYCRAVIKPKLDKLS